ncbi:YIP1 family protein [Ktedonobacteria bacterium brp13]|jgi:hypothetical protein|nr:YIP1 family protein [Ktedonobacteria bacterium brp13]
MSANQQPKQAGGTLRYSSRPQARRGPGGKLPGWYIRAILKPTPKAFAETSEYARWPLVWTQLIILLLIPLALGGIRLLFHDHSTGINPRSNILFGTISILTVGVSVGATILKAFFVPIIFFVGTALQYGIARILGGRGHYVGHCFSLLLYQLPLSIIGAVIIAVLIILHIQTFFYSPIVTIVLFVYGVIINIIAVMGIHHINQNRATTAVIVPYVLGIIVLGIIVSAVAHTLFNAAHP